MSKFQDLLREAGRAAPRLKNGAKLQFDVPLWTLEERQEGEKAIVVGDWGAGMVDEQGKVLSPGGKALWAKGGSGEAALEALIYKVRAVTTP